MASISSLRQGGSLGAQEASVGEITLIVYLNVIPSPFSKSIFWYEPRRDTIGPSPTRPADDVEFPLDETLHILCKTWLKSYTKSVTLQEFLDKALSA